jgi:hypothetical protein
MDVAKTIDSLRRNGYTVSCFETGEAAADYINGSIDHLSVGFGDSATLMQLHLYESLSAHNTVFDPVHREAGKSFNATARVCLTTDVFLTSVNALSETGELINIDGTGNRVAGSLFGHKKVYFVAGMNKIAPTLEDAIWRARNVAAPLNAMRLGLKTPCAPKGDRCYDCSNPDRICNCLVIHYKKMNDIDMEVVLINEALGY